MSQDVLRARVLEAARAGGAEAVAAAWFDYRHRTEWSLNGDEWFHAASTIKVPVLLGVYGAIEAGRFEPHSRVHVRNRFLSVVDGAPFRVEPQRDANRAVHAAVGKTMRVVELARHMIVTSSNLATNLLVDLVGLDEIRRTIDELHISGIEVVRGVEDEPAWQAGLNNRATAHGLLAALRAIEEGRAVSEHASSEMLAILHDQEFRSGIPAGLPDEARVANKTGEMSTVAHDAGIVYLPDREPYVLVVLTRWTPDATARQRTIAAISRAVFEHITEGDGDA
ncbi:MAG: serine hydrolase, partial [Longimicrobiales bacterium]